MKIWDVNVNSVVNTFTMGSNVLDQQLGCLWQKDHLLSISLSGYINYLDKNNPSKPLRVIKVRPGHGAARPARAGRGEGGRLAGEGAAEARWRPTGTAGRGLLWGCEFSRNERPDAEIPFSCCESWTFRAAALTPAHGACLSRGAQPSSVRSPPAVSPTRGRTRKMLSPEPRHVAGCGRSCEGPSWPWSWARMMCRV